MDEMAVGPAKPDLVACSSCGHLHPTTTRFCDQCGTPQGRLCQECGGVNAHTAKFCSGCGAPLQDWSSSTPSITGGVVVRIASS